MTSDPGLASWLQLTLAPGLGAATLRRLLSQFGLPEKVIAANRAELARFASAEALQALDSDAVARSVDRALAWLEQPGNAIVTLADAAYPKLLLEISDPPAVLYCRGRTDLLNQPALAVVVTSGYSDEMIRSGIPAKPGVGYLSKPCDTSVLTAAVRQSLDQIKP